MTYTNNILESYAQPLSATENQLCKNAILMVSDALKTLGFSTGGIELSPLYEDTYSYHLRMTNSQNSIVIRLLLQGSYANNTNVRSHSDVDIAVIREDQFKAEYRTDSNYPQSNDDYHFTSVDNDMCDFKDKVQEALEYKFKDDVERKNKSIKVHGNTYRKDSDVVPCLRYRDYRRDYSKDPDNFIGGIRIFADDGSIITNYPEQHIENGRIKNTNTHHYFKKYVRVIKGVRYDMLDAQNPYIVSIADGVSSFMLESLLWNISDAWYLSICPNYSYVNSFSLLIDELLKRKYEYSSYREINNIKPLCENDDAKNRLIKFVETLKAIYRFSF